jgi:predicted phosphodiesterase
MRIALISDPHGDFVALQAVISDIERQNDLDEVLVGGDLAQGGPQPAEVVDEIRRRGWPSVRGNSDDFLVQMADRTMHETAPPEDLVTVLAYGHIHTPYKRRVGDAVLLSVGAIGGSNDADSLPAYTIVDLGPTVTVEVRRVDCSVADRISAIDRSGLELSAKTRASFGEPGPFPVRSRPGAATIAWP